MWRDGVAFRLRDLVLRPPAPQKARVEVNRYRGRDREVARDGDETGGAACRCNPGQYAVVHLTGDHLPPIRLPLAPPSMATAKPAT